MPEETNPTLAPSDVPYGRRPNNLPLHLTSFVGRGREKAEVERLLADSRLLTLTGPGGSGKTRLALTVASEAARNFEDGVWLVELAPLSDPDLVPQAVASVLGVLETPGISLVEALRAHLETRRVLLVLDNCEHLVGACSRLVGTLLGSCPDLRILATSREALGVPGERLYPVPPLSLPDPRRPSATEGLARYEAAKLFVDRARAVKPNFSLTEGNAPAVAQICYRLDGMPLAIELAAARTRVLSAEQISARLEGSFALLSGGGRTAISQHKTLRATMDWSYGLLSEEERALLRRLSVFAGGFTLEVAGPVAMGEAAAEDEVLELLASLVDKSLVLVAEQEGEVRYRLLETLRQYGREKLEEAGEEAEVGERHADLFLDLAERAEPGLKGHGQVEWLGRLESEHDNLRSAMRWLLDHREAETAARLAWALWLFWYLHGHLAEGYRYAGVLLDQTYDLPTVTRAKVLIVRGNMSYGRESIEGTKRLFEEAVALSRQTGNKVDLAIALAGIGVTAMQQGDMQGATTTFEEVLELYREEANKWGMSYALVHLGMAPLSRGDHAGARRYFEEALALSREIGYRLSGYISLYGLALAAHVQGDQERAAELYTEGLELAVEAGDKANAAYCLEGLAGLITARDDPERATRLFGASEALLEAVGGPRYAYAQDRTLYEGALDSLRSRLGEEGFETAWADGRAMSSEEAITYALATPETPTETQAAYPASLSAREVEVLKLVASGMTNAEIAGELYISPRTVNAHLGSVYHKIGSSTRAEAARFASEHGLL